MVAPPTRTLELLGRLVLRPEDEGARSVLRQPKRFGLLAYLACTGGRCRRDVLLPLFWPDMDRSRGRAALRRALHFLRGHLGDGAIRGHRKSYVEVAPARLGCDVDRFRRAIREGELAEALSLYRGPLLPGFFVDGADGFQRWLDGQRSELRRTAHEAALGLAHAEEDRGLPERALLWARRAQGIRPHDGETVRLVTALLDGLGRPAAALEEYEAHGAWVRDELDANPSLEMRELADRVRTRLTSGGDVAPAAREHDEAGALYREIVETAADVVFRTTLDGYYTYVNPAACRLLGRGRRELVGSLHLDFVREDYRDRLHAFYLRQVQERTARTHYELPALQSDGETVWLEQVVQLVERDGEPVALQGVARDISVRKRVEKAQRGLATKDRATGLPNERGFDILAEARIRFARQEGSGIAVAIVDVEETGAAAEPELRRIAEALAASVRHADLLARTGSRRFAVLVLADSDQEAATFEARLHERVCHHWDRLELAGPVPAIESHFFRGPDDALGDQIVSLVRGGGERAGGE